MILKPEVSYYEWVKGGKFNRNSFSTIEGSILNIDFYDKLDSEGYVSSFRYTEDLVSYIKQNGRIRGYAGPVKTDFLYWDFDSKDITLAYQDTLELVERLLDAKVADTSIRIDYSGKKGFHVLVPSGDIEELGSNVNLNSIVKEVCMYFADDLATADDQIYNRTGIFRVVNSKHPDTGKYCIPLSVEEFTGNTLEAISEMASKQKAMPDDFDKVPYPNRTIGMMINRAVKSTVDKSTGSNKKGLGYSKLVDGIINGFPDGQWNAGFTSVAGVLHRHGLDDFAAAFLHCMNDKGDDPMPESAINTIISSVSKYEVDEQYKEPDSGDIVSFSEARDRWVKLRSNYKEIRTGFKMLDEKLFNFDAGKVMLVAAYSRVGKTNWGIQLAKNITQFDDEDGLFTSLEMSASSLFYRAAVIDDSYNGVYRTSREQTDYLLANVEAQDKVCKNWESIKIVDKSCLSTQQIDGYQTMAEQKSEFNGRKSRLLIIDYIELIKNTDDTRKLATAARDIKNIAKNHNIRVILLAQLNRTNGDEYSEPTTNSIKGSSEIFNAADVVLGLWRSREQKNRVHAKELKNREEEDGLYFDMLQTGLGYEETTYMPDSNGTGDEFWGVN